MSSRGVRPRSAVKAKLQNEDADSLLQSLQNRIEYLRSEEKKVMKDTEKIQAQTIRALSATSSRSQDTAVRQCAQDILTSIHPRKGRKALLMTMQDQGDRTACCPAAGTVEAAVSAQQAETALGSDLTTCCTGEQAPGVPCTSASAASLSEVCSADAGAQYDNGEQLRVGAAPAGATSGSCTPSEPGPSSIIQPQGSSSSRPSSGRGTRAQGAAQHKPSGHPPAGQQPQQQQQQQRIRPRPSSAPRASTTAPDPFPAGRTAPPARFPGRERTNLNSMQMACGSSTSTTRHTTLRPPLHPTASPAPAATAAQMQILAPGDAPLSLAASSSTSGRQDPAAAALPAGSSVQQFTTAESTSSSRRVVSCRVPLRQQSAPSPGGGVARVELAGAGWGSGPATTVAVHAAELRQLSADLDKGRRLQQARSVFGVKAGAGSSSGNTSSAMWVTGAGAWHGATASTVDGSRQAA